MCIGKLDNIVNTYNNTYHRKIKMNPVNLKSSIYIYFDKENNTEGPNGDDVRIPKYENIFAKSYFSNWSKEVFVIKKVKNTVPWTYVISDFKVYS